jgi:transposase InsO family protein
VPDHWLAKVPAPDRPRQVWQSDFTYVENGEGWLYLAFTLDACTRRCVAHHCLADLGVELAITTFRLALQRQPPPPGLLHDSDRSAQYASADLARLTAAHWVTRRIVFDYIETFSNPYRRHSPLAYRSPLEFEKQMSAQKRSKPKSTI